MERNKLNIEPVTFTDNKLILIDQTKLPNETVYLEMATKEDVWDAIYQLKVRGAPAIGVAAGYGLYISVRELPEQNADAFATQVREIKAYLDSSRPTAVNLSWALNRMEACLDANLDKPVQEIKELLLAEARAIHQEDVESCRAMGEHGLSLLKSGMGILTHCNAGILATSKYGTALSPLYVGHEQGYDFKVFADETRPLLQGARLTAWELHNTGLDVTLICDNMASIVMKNGWIDAVIVGCDRMAANGDGANKIGTSGVAILAKEYGIPFYMAVPTSTIDMSLASGAEIPIEERNGEEIYKLWYEKDMGPAGIKTFNPAFDVTDAKYITAVITEKGIVYPPYRENLPALFE